MPTIAKSSIKKKKFRGPEIKTCYSATVNKTMQYWLKDRKIRPVEQNKRPKTDPYISGQLVHERSDTAVQCLGRNLFNKSG